MASVRLKPNSKYYYACFTDQHGEQKQRSTKVTRRDLALKVAERFESAYATRLSEAQARRVVAEIYKDVRGEPLFHDTARAYLTRWLESKKNEVGKSSEKRYRQIIEDFLESLGPRADEDFAYITKDDLTAFRDQIAAKNTAANANTCIKIIRIPFAQAMNEGIRPDNPARAVKKLKVLYDPNAPERRDYTLDEIDRVLSVADHEWRGLILAGAFTGQRLGDIASWTWRRFHEQENLITVRTLKTNRAVVVPVAPVLLEYLKSLPAHSPEEPIFPRANKARRDADGESRALSNKFYALLVEAGLAPKRSKKNTGRGHSGKRQVGELGFHSLRHTATSQLKAANVPEAIVRDIIGHDSTLVSRRYTHVHVDAKRVAIKKFAEQFQKQPKKSAASKAKSVVAPRPADHSHASPLPTQPPDGGERTTIAPSA